MPSPENLEMKAAAAAAMYWGEAWLTLWRLCEALALEADFLREVLRIRSAVILDAGCGDGRFFEMLRITTGLPASCESFQVLGVDSSSDRLSKLALRESRIHAIQANLDNIPLQSEHSDVVLANSTIEHCASPIEVLREFHRVLKIGGLLLLTVPSVHFERLLLGTKILGLINTQASQRYSSWKSARITHLEYLPIEDWKVRLLDEGFEVVSCAPIASPRVVAVGDGLQWIRDLGIGGSRYSLRLTTGWATSLIARPIINLQTKMAINLLRHSEPTFEQCGAYAIACRKL